VIRGRRVIPDQINEAVNLDLGVLFVAIPKTGTTSIRDQLRPRGLMLCPFGHLDIRQIRDLFYPFHLIRSLDSNRSFPTEGVKSDDEVRAEAAAQFDGLFKFASVRNPWARAVSLYHRGEGIRRAGDLSFEQFCERHLYASDTCRKPTLHANQIDWLTDEEGRIAVDHVVRIEELATELDTLRETSGGRVRLEALQRNVNPRSTASRYRDIYTDRTRKLIAARFERDIDAFGYVF
jgi:hypothetical protein